jgi:hypothetical protein
MTEMHVVLLLAPRLDNANHTKDIDFSRPAFADDGRAAIRTRPEPSNGRPGMIRSIRSKG